MIKPFSKVAQVHVTIRVEAKQARVKEFMENRPNTPFAINAPSPSKSASFVNFIKITVALQIFPKKIVPKNEISDFQILFTDKMRVNPRRFK